MAFLFLVMWIILSTTNCTYTTINGTWYDDFTGWTVDGTNTMDGPVNTYTYKYHGPFSGDDDIPTEQFSMTQSFYCAELSSVNVDYYIFFCGTEKTDYVTLTLSLTGQTTLYTSRTTLQKPGTAIEYSDISLPRCDTLWAKDSTHNQYYYYPLTTPYVHVALNNLFTVQFDITVNYLNDYVMFRNISIQCLPITHSPTSPTTPTLRTPPPTTPAPTTPAPTTPAPTTSAPTTSAPTTSAPTTSAPTTPAPTTSAPTTPAPTTSAPTTPAPTTSAPTAQTPSPTNHPTNDPTHLPSNNPSKSPTYYPSNNPTKYPTLFPSTSPTYSPTLPTNMPSISPTHPPSAQPSTEPSATPTLQPTVTKPKGVDAGSGDVSGEIIVIVSILVGLCCVAIVVGFYCAKYRGVDSKKNKLDNNGFDSNHYVQLIDNGPQTVFGTAVKSVSLGNTTAGGPAFNGNTNGGRYLVDDESSTDMEDVQEDGSDDDVINDMITPQDPLNDDADSHESDNDVVDDMITPQ